MNNAKKALFFTLGAAVAVGVVIFAFLLRPGGPGRTDAVGAVTPVAVETAAPTATTTVPAPVRAELIRHYRDTVTGRFVKCK